MSIDFASQQWEKVMAKSKTRGKTSKSTVTKVAAIKRICNLVPSKGIESDWQFRDAVSSGALGAVAAPPASVDLRQSWWTIGDQGQTGSCVGWATAEGVMRYHMVAANRLGKNEQLSPRYVWMASKETDQYTQRPETFIEEAGTSLKAPVDICRKYGVVTMALLPFNISTLMHTGPENTFFATAAQRKIAAYFNLQKDLNNGRTGLPCMARYWPDFRSTRRGTMLRPRTEISIRSIRILCAAGTQSLWLDIRLRAASSSATVGAPLGATGDSATLRPRISRAHSSTSRTV
jgi:hypothetical protein